MGSRLYSYSGEAACLADCPGCLSARTESGVHNRCGRRRAVDDGRAGHMKNTVARPGFWKAVDGQRAVPRLIVCRRAAGGQKRYIHCI